MSGEAQGTSPVVSGGRGLQIWVARVSGLSAEANSRVAGGQELADEIRRWSGQVRRGSPE